ncbi:MAG: FKBP-type peptidyl-prolyl cis-trans isomerase [Proteobacteria bacterium]|nr:FKBP-type peptidyl-prolyl cis-trans isomerase [Pseudomonadota bacterium]
MAALIAGSLLLAGSGPALGEEPAAPPAAAPAGPAEDPSYDIGLMLGSQLHQNGLADTVRFDALVQGLRAGLGGRLASDAQRAAANEFLRAGRDAVAGRERAAAKEFLERNAKADGVHTTASGLQYQVLAAGNAAAPSPGTRDQVTVQYLARRADGTEFDSSAAHGHPATLRVDSVLKGWREALLLMKPGAEWKIFVPPDLAYGNAPPPGVPPGALLIYELKLLAVTPPSVAPPKASAPAARATTPAAEPPAK